LVSESGGSGWSAKCPSATWLRQASRTHTYSRIETGAREPSLRAIRKLAEKLGVTALYLETGSDDAVCPYCGRPPT
jgi:transcriptional regulator with XRE-family HTH domain